MERTLTATVILLIGLALGYKQDVPMVIYGPTSFAVGLYVFMMLEPKQRVQTMVVPTPKPMFPFDLNMVEQGDPKNRWKAQQWLENEGENHPHAIYVRLSLGRGSANRS